MTAPSNCQGNLAADGDGNTASDDDKRGDDRQPGYHIIFIFTAKKISEIGRLKSGVVATIGETTTTRRSTVAARP